jgi:hypothetical protein
MVTKIPHAKTKRIMDTKPTTVLITYGKVNVALAEKHRLPIDELDTIVFDSKREAVAYCAGVADGSSWDEVHTEIE